MNEKTPKSKAPSPVVSFIEETGQTVELFHLDPEFVKFLDKLAGIVKTQSEGYADFFMQMKGDVQEVQVKTSYRKGYNF